MIYFHNARIYTPTEMIEGGALISSGETIIATGSAASLTAPIGAEVIDAGGKYIVPGFIDLQVNGAFGMDFTTDPQSIWQVGERLTRFGVTAFLPTIISAPPDAIRTAQAVWLQGPPDGYQGARALGLHLEGPYLNPEKSGAHDAAWLCLPDPEIYREWTPVSGVCLVTLAPELPGAVQAIQTLVENGVAVSAGHSAATFEQAEVGIDAGIRSGTHLFNAMPPLDHRQPGMVAALLGDERVTAGLIVDGIHVHPEMVKLAWKILGSRRICLVTDSMAALGMPPGRYELGSRRVTVDDTSAQLEDGRLAGSLLSLDVALQNLMRYTGASFQEALPTITQVPARLLHLEKTMGVLSSGARADLLMLSTDFQAVEVWVGGQKVSR